MSKKEKVLDDMRAGETWEKLDKSSKATLYSAYNTWEQEAGAHYTKVNEEIKAGETSRDVVSIEVRELTAKRDSFLPVIKEREETLKRLDARVSSLQGSADKAQSELASANKGLANLAARRITPEIITQIASTDVSDPEDLFTRVKTKGEYKALVAENAKLIAGNKGLDEDCAKKQSQSQELDRTIASKNAQADELTRANYDYIAVINVILLFLKRGYTLALLRSLLDRLKQFEIDGDPKLSVTRLIDALGRMQSIVNLDSVIMTKNAELATLNGLIDKAKGIFAAYKDAAIAELKALEVAIMQHLNSQVSEAQRVSQDALVQLKANFATYANVTNSARDNTIRTFNNDLNAMLRVMLDTQTALKSEIEEWGKIMKSSGKMEEQLKQSATLLALQKDPASITQISPDVIVSLQRSIDIYIKAKLSTAETKPSQKIYDNNRLGLSNTFPVKLRDLSSWIVEELTRRMLEGSL